MKRMDVLRLLALVLALVMMLGCFAACGKDSGKDKDVDDDVQATNGTEKPGTVVPDQSDELRKGLKKVEYEGLTAYLPKDMEDRDGGIYANDDLMVELVCEHISDLDEEVTDLKGFVAYMSELFESAYGEDLVSGRANGVDYIMVEDTVMGLYMAGSTVGCICVAAEDFETFEDEMIKYATLGTLEDYYKDFGTGEVDMRPVVEDSLNGLHYKVPKDWTREDYDETLVEYIYERDYWVSVSSFEAPQFADLEAMVDEYWTLVEENDEARKDNYLGVPCFTYFEGETARAMGLYFHEGYAWIVDVRAPGADEAAVLELAASGWIVENEVPEVERPDQPDLPANVIECGGLVLTMKDDHIIDGNGSDNVYAYNDTAEIMIGRLESGGKTARELLAFAESAYQGIYGTVALEEIGGKQFLLCADSDGYMSILYIYAEGDSQWEVMLSGYFEDEMVLTDLLDQISSGTIQ